MREHTTSEWVTQLSGGLASWDPLIEPVAASRIVKMVLYLDGKGKVLSYDPQMVAHMNAKRAARAVSHPDRLPSLTYANNFHAPDNPSVGVSGRQAVRGLRAASFQRIRDACAVLHLDERLIKGFLTLTTPAGSNRALIAFHGNLAQINKAVRQAMKRVSRRFDKGCAVHFLEGELPDDLQTGYVCVAELQERGAIHYHMAYGARCECELRDVYAVMQESFWRALERVSDSVGIDIFEKKDGTSWRGSPWVLQSKLEYPVRNLKRYLSKYLSKHVSKEGEHGVERSLLVPSMSHWISKRIKEGTIVRYRECASVQESERIMKETNVVLAQHNAQCRALVNPYDERFMGWTFYAIDNDTMSLHHELKKVLLSGCGPGCHSPPVVPVGYRGDILLEKLKFNLRNTDGKRYRPWCHLEEHHRDYLRRLKGANRQASGDSRQHSEKRTDTPHLEPPLQLKTWA